MSTFEIQLAIEFELELELENRCYSNTNHFNSIIKILLYEIQLLALASYYISYPNIILFILNTYTEVIYDL